MALSRLTYGADSGTVTYQSDKASGPTAGAETVDALEFLARVVSHIPTKGQALPLRHYTRQTGQPLAVTLFTSEGGESARVPCGFAPPRCGFARASRGFASAHADSHDPRADLHHPMADLHDLVGIRSGPRRIRMRLLRVSIIPVHIPQACSESV